MISDVTLVAPNRTAMEVPRGLTSALVPRMRSGPSGRSPREAPVVSTWSTSICLK